MRASPPWHFCDTLPQGTSCNAPNASTRQSRSGSECRRKVDGYRLILWYLAAGAKRHGRTRTALTARNQLPHKATLRFPGLDTFLTSATLPNNLIATTRILHRPLSAISELLRPTNLGVNCARVWSRCELIVFGASLSVVSLTCSAISTLSDLSIIQDVTGSGQDSLLSGR